MLDAICFQETNLATRNSFTLSNFYTIRRSGKVNRAQHRGVAVSIHTGLPYQAIKLKIYIQAIAVTRRLHTHCSHIETITLKGSKSKLPTPGRLPTAATPKGDFNSYNVIWELRTTDVRGRVVETFIIRNKM